MKASVRLVVAVSVIALPVLVIALSEIVSAFSTKPLGEVHPKLNERLLRKVDDPTSWPFKVEQGVLACQRNPLSPALSAVTFEAGGKIYGLNGGALTGGAFNDVSPLVERNEVGLYKVSLGPIVLEGLDLCKKLPLSKQPTGL